MTTASRTPSFFFFLYPFRYIWQERFTCSHSVSVDGFFWPRCIVTREGCQDNSQRERAKKKNPLHPRLTRDFLFRPFGHHIPHVWLSKSGRPAGSQQRIRLLLTIDQAAPQPAATQIPPLFFYPTGRMDRNAFPFSVIIDISGTKPPPPPLLLSHGIGSCSSRRWKMGRAGRPPREAAIAHRGCCDHESWQ